MLGALLATHTFSGRLAAQPQEFGPYHRPAPGADAWGTSKGSRVALVPTGEFVHDGFYLRLAGGLGGASDKLKGPGHSSAGTAGQLEGSVSGLAGATQVAIGFTPARGWVVGFAVDTVTLVGSSGTLSSEVGRFEFDISQLALYGILLDVYLDPLRGFHVQASGGICSFVMGQGNPPDTDDADAIAPPHAAIGGGFSLGVGNQWWLGPDWTLGVLPRFMLGWASGTDQFGGSFSHRVIGYSLLLTTTYH